MLDWFQRFMPREHVFFPLFEWHATVVTAGAKALRSMLDPFIARRSCAMRMRHH